MFRQPRHEGGVGYSVGGHSTTTQRTEERHCAIDVSAGTERAEDDVVGLEVGGDAATEGTVGEGGEEGVSVGVPTRADKRVKERVMGADAGVAAEEGGEIAERGEGRVGHESTGEGR